MHINNPGNLQETALVKGFRYYISFLHVKYIGEDTAAATEIAYLSGLSKRDTCAMLMH